MARIAGVNIPNHQHTVIGLTAIFGIGTTRANKICKTTGVAIDKKVKDLTDADLEKLRDEVGKVRRGRVMLGKGRWSVVTRSAIRRPHILMRIRLTSVTTYTDADPLGHQ
jgi:ribosomal protein S13